MGRPLESMLHHWAGVQNKWGLGPCDSARASSFT
jgi:hypothetical protein